MNSNSEGMPKLILSTGHIIVVREGFNAEVNEGFVYNAFRGDLWNSEMSTVLETNKVFTLKGSSVIAVLHSPSNDDGS
jgi:hypothetical protein